jgi:membrane associated rhomboid family serine protease
MVFPIADDNSDRIRTPYVNYALIVANVLVFVGPQGFGENLKFTYALSCVPAEIVTGRDIVQPDEIVVDPISQRRVLKPGLQPTPIPVYLTLLTSMFMHGGLGHLFGNMLFLWIFGDNIEDKLGHLRYLLFYVVCGIAAGLAHVAATYAFGNNPLIPCLGASGAISGVLGGYLLLFPLRRVTVILFRFLTDVPAYVAIGLWFLFQIINSLGAFGPGSAEGGVAYGAHIGGFLAGAALIHPFSFDLDHQDWDRPVPRRFYRC